jgi:hypothetical protein
MSAWADTQHRFPPSDERAGQDVHDEAEPSPESLDEAAVASIHARQARSGAMPMQECETRLERLSRLAMTEKGDIDLDRYIA